MSWFNRTVIGAGLTSFLADVGYELASALLPTFLLALGLPFGLAAQVMGAIEAVAEFLSNAAKLLVGWYSDRIGKRKAFVVGGYALTGVAFAFCAVAAGWPLVMLAKSLAWLGKGIRGPLRNAIITDAVAPADRGKAFGFHRAGDTLGAVLGPLIAAGVLWATAGDWSGVLDGTDATGSYRLAFWFTLVPGLGAALVFWRMVREQRFTPKPGLRLGASVRAMPAGYRRFLVGVGLFGIGDFAHTLLILAAVNSLAESPDAKLEQAAVIAVLLYAWRNFCQALAAFPAGWLGDHIGHVRVLVGGYLIAAATMAGFAGLVLSGSGSLVGWAALFALAGVYMAVQEALEPAIVPDLVPDRAVHGTAFGVLAVVNGLGDVAASLVVGMLFRYVGPAAGLGYAAFAMMAGAVWMALNA
ncbi:MAG TPA: MFS transporter, partial [Fimbriiglobus sp.]|nr:MFS transporter [Fimbriiglobus sp.]